MTIDATQRDRETRLYAEGREKVLATVMKAEREGKSDSLPYQNYLVRQAIEYLVGAIERDILAKAGAGGFKKYAQYLGTIDPRLAALRAIQAVLRVLVSKGGLDAPAPVWHAAATQAGKAVYAEYLMQHFKKLSPPLFNSLLREYDRAMTKDEAHLLRAFKTKFKSEGYEFPTWEFGEAPKVGQYVLEQLVAARFLETWSRTESHKGKAMTVRYLVLAEELRGASLALVERVAALPKVSAPLIEPPLEWDARTNTGGGFHTEDLQRIHPYAIQGRGPNAVSKAVIDTLNTLQGVAWTINPPVLRAVRYISQRRDFGDIVSPDPGPRPDYREDFTDEEKRAWKATMHRWYTEKKVRASKHLRVQRVFQEAQELLAYPAVWFAYYADFRGRVYVRSNGVSPQGDDLQKGLLRLRVGKPITPEAEPWFLSAGANRYGLDKVSLEEQIKWVQDNDEFIRRMGEHPEQHSEWADADSPVQFLAWAIEYAAWRRDPEGFESHLPLGQDGTCNGLQHFSALMRDPVGGAAVNLLPGPAPRDIYSDVASRVTEKLQAMPPHPYRDGWLAHGITRKITKRPVMTLPYGSTRFAASSFIVDYIEDESTPTLDTIPPGEWGDAANWLSHVVWSGMGASVGKAMEVMAWLQGWAKHAVDTGQEVSWTTPTGLRVVSEYPKFKKVRVKSVVFGNSRIQLVKPSGKIDKVKTANAVAPNFVHSLDASHMARVVARAKAEGMTPVTSHDDFGVHAADTPRFREIIREEFVRIYKDNTLLTDLAASTSYPVPPPEVGDLDLADILVSTYFFF